MSQTELIGDIIQRLQKACTDAMKLETILLAKKFDEAKIFEDLAEDFEKKFNYTEAITYYQKAATLYENNDKLGKFLSCMNKAAKLLFARENYEEAVELFENIVEKIKNDDILKWSSEFILFDASLCRLMLGNLEIEKYENMLTYKSFKTGHRGKFIIELSNAIKNKNISLFTDLIEEYEKITKLGELQVIVLDRIKKTLK